MRAAEARDRLNADLVLFPELSLCGYPPEDLLFHKGCAGRSTAALERVRAETSGISASWSVIPNTPADGIYNAAALVRDGETLANYRKQELPNYAVFDEKRYFNHGRSTRIVEIERHSRRDADLRRRLGAGPGARREGGRRAAHRRDQRLAVFAGLSGRRAKASCAIAFATPACRSST